MARSKTVVCIPTLTAAISAVESNGGVENLEKLYAMVARKYAATVPEGFAILSAQTVKARIEELVSADKLTLKTQPGRRVGNGQNVVSKKEQILDNLQNLDEMIVELMEKSTDEATNAILQKISDGLVEVADIVSSLHNRKKSSEETETEGSTEMEVAPTMETEEIPASPEAA